MELSTIVTITSLWLALAVIAVSSLLAIDRTSRRDRCGFIDRSALDAISLVIGGPVVAAAIICAPIMTRGVIASHPAATSSRVPGAGAYLVSDAWVWVATVVAIFWLYAVASTIVVTVMYFRQQRRIRAS